MSNRSGWARPAGLVAGWLAVAAVAIAIGVVAVTQVGDTLRDRGPIGTVADRGAIDNGPGTPDPAASVEKKTFTEEFGEIDVSCQGAFASGVDARPADGWRTVSFETEPDEDIDAVFALGERSIEIEVFCNRGKPTVSEIEQNTLPDD